MSEAEISGFVHSYGPSDLERIRFDWNGKHADELRDPNIQFRHAVCEYVTKHFSEANDQLIRDMYAELSKCAEEAWGVYKDFHLFAQELLDRGVTKYLLDYAEGAVRCFDTMVSSGRVTLTDQQRSEINVFLETELPTCSDTRTKALLEFVRDRLVRNRTNA